ncbi:hypothetical protein OEZ85_001688 [Tetradesmus obliquus]|uniref:C2 domain-containing protein n=1 Tax=Tetradesmus obliquus TaxID=3088 RepID=A0ABY8U0V6_TETOB|nr:hypothetical protein OEZ85_001688 [Tetradesmus obliquus]
MVYILQAKNLPGMDWWNGLADPYVIITALPPGEQGIQYTTKTVYKDLNPTFDEFFEVGNLPGGTSVLVEVWDKDVVTEDDMIGRASWAFAPRELLPAAVAGGLAGDASWGRLMVPLKLQHPRNKKDMGTVELEVCYRPSVRAGKPAMMGPVKFKQTLSPTAGLFTGHFWGRDDTMCFSTYKLYLLHIDATFKDVRMPWNRKYDKAVQIFKSPVALGLVRTQHRTLYATNVGMSRCGVLGSSKTFFELFKCGVLGSSKTFFELIKCGVLGSSKDFFELFKCGVRGGQRRYFTYCLLRDSLRCSETGAAFFNDMLSKHAMHAGGEEEVLYAGEFCIVPDASAAAGYRLVIDNNSGTYAPAAAKLPLMSQLFTANFPDMVVEVLASDDPRLKQYQQECPSRATA